MVNLLPDEFPTPQDCLIDICESQRAVLDWEGALKKGEVMVGIEDKDYISWLKQNGQTPCLTGWSWKHRMAFLVILNWSLSWYWHKKCQEIIQLVRQRHMGFLEAVNRIYFFLLLSWNSCPQSSNISLKGKGPVLRPHGRASAEGSSEMLSSTCCPTPHTLLLFFLQIFTDRQ